MNFLTQREADYCETILDEFERAEYLPALTRSVREQGMSTATMPLLFELRFAKALRGRGSPLEYERQTLGDTSVDFAVNTGEPDAVLVELLAIGTSDAVRRALREEVDESGIRWTELILRTNNDDHRESEEGEALLVQQKICEKVLRGGQPIKFDVPTESGAFQVIAVDMRGFLGGGCPDRYDYIQLCYGNSKVHPMHRRFWSHEGVQTAIRGLFEDTERPRGAPTLRGRIHGILFTADTTYVDGGLMGSAFLAHNPDLITTNEQLDKLKLAVIGA